MKRLLLMLLVSVATLGVSATEQLAFPGAEGFGRFTSGGRGGNVYYVTRLDDCSDNDLVEGTLRWALRSGDDSPRTVLFRVCGTIYLTSKLKLEHPNVTIAGQTAPGGGICIAGANIYVCKPNVIIRYVRFRSGDVIDGNYQCLDVENTKHVIIDHCSLTWAVEECLTMYDCDSTTVQWTIIGEGLYNAGHKKGQRSYAAQWGGEHGTMHHCLITNCYNRTPRFNGVRDEANLAEGKHNHDAQVDNEFVNNVIYNWGKKNSLYGGENDSTKNRVDGVNVGYNHVYMINNYFRCGPTTQAANLSTRYFVQGSKVGDWGQWWLAGNKFETGNKWNATEKSVWTDDNLALVNNDNLYGFTTNQTNRAFNLDGITPSQEVYERYVLPAESAELQVNRESADEAFLSVCRKAGASLPRYDEEDSRLLKEAAGEVDPLFVGSTQKHWYGIIDSQNDILFTRQDYYRVGDSVVGGYPFLDAELTDSLALDSDEDGLPDAYELEVGLNPLDALDGALIGEDGYSNLEHYLNGVADGLIVKSRYEHEVYVSQEPDAPTSLLTTKQHKTTSDQQSYDLQGRLIEKPQTGMMYIRQGGIYLQR